MYIRRAPPVDENGQGAQNPSQGGVCRLNIHSEIHKGVLTLFFYCSDTVPLEFLKFEQVVLICRGVCGTGYKFTRERQYVVCILYTMVELLTFNQRNR